MDPQVVSSIVLGSAGIIITIIFSLLRHKIEHDRIMKELFVEFNSRYDKLNDNLNLIKEKYDELKKGKDDVNQIAITFKSEKELYPKLIDYFNLCAEEYYWTGKKRIDDEIWNSWLKGMKYWYNEFPIIEYIWKDEIKGENWKSYYLESNINIFELDFKK